MMLMLMLMAAGDAEENIAEPAWCVQLYIQHRQRSVVSSKQCMTSGIMLFAGRETLEHVCCISCTSDGHLQASQRPHD